MLRSDKMVATNKVTLQYHDMTAQRCEILTQELIFSSDDYDVLLGEGDIIIRV